MAEVLNYVKPHPLLNPREPMGRMRAAWNPSATTAEQWKRGDLVEVVAATGFVRKVVQTTPANILRMSFAAADYDVSPLGERYSYYTDRGVALDTLRDGHIVIFTYQGATANDEDHEFVAADLAAVQAQESRELVYNPDRGVLTIRNGGTNPNVKMRYVFKGGVGDSNVQVACIVLPAFRAEV